MCWAFAQDDDFTQNILPAFCARTDVKIAFGHPDVQKCGECSELRVERRDGGYNYVTVMTTDHPETTNSSLKGGIGCHHARVRPPLSNAGLGSVPICLSHGRVAGSVC